MYAVNLRLFCIGRTEILGVEPSSFAPGPRHAWCWEAYWTDCEADSIRAGPGTSGVASVKTEDEALRGKPIHWNGRRRGIATMYNGVGLPHFRLADKSKNVSQSS